jgi:hypothetical protein
MPQRLDRAIVGVDIPTPDEVAAILELAKQVAKGRFRPIFVTASPAFVPQSCAGFVGKMSTLKRTSFTSRQRADRFKDIGRPKRPRRPSLKVPQTVSQN